MGFPFQAWLEMMTDPFMMNLPSSDMEDYCRVRWSRVDQHVPTCWVWNMCVEYRENIIMTRESFQRHHPRGGKKKRLYIILIIWNKKTSKQAMQVFAMATGMYSPQKCLWHKNSGERRTSKSSSKVRALSIRHSMYQTQILTGKKPRVSLRIGSGLRIFLA